jgi:magnesium chelatase family protein
MSLSLVQSRALLGMRAHPVCVEVHLANGLPSFTLVGLAETEVKEARERVRSAIQNSGLDFPSNKRITVNLAPADLPKDSGRFDLPIALGILAASGQIDSKKLGACEFAGELSLGGELRPIRGALAMSLALPVPDAGQPVIKLVLPQDSAQEAALVPHAEVYRARHLLDVVRQFLPGNGVPADVKGQAAAKRALEIAAAGGHSLLLVGSPGSGKSMLAQRFAGLLPDMSTEEALQSAVIASLGGRFSLDRWARRPTCAPHHTASAVALVGGGSPPRPGEISLAHHGVFNELPEFPRAALEALREPLESGRVTISRAAQRAEFPARFQLIAAMNPCPCGYLGSSLRSCRCSPDQVSRYQGKLSGPLLDRIALHIELGALAAEELLGAAPGESTAIIRQRALQAHQRAFIRQGSNNQALQGKAIDIQCQLDYAAGKFLQAAAMRLGWSGRGIHRCLKVARTIADLARAAAVQVTHVAAAAQYRRALKANP